MMNNNVNVLVSVSKTLRNQKKKKKQSIDPVCDKTKTGFTCCHRESYGKVWVLLML